MKTAEEIDELAANLANPNACKTANWIEGYRQCEKDVAESRYDREEIEEMALDYIINTGGLPQTIDDWKGALWKFYQHLNQQD